MKTQRKKFDEVFDQMHSEQKPKIRVNSLDYSRRFAVIDIKAFIYKDVGEYEIEFEIQEGGISLVEALEIYKEKYNNGHLSCGSEVLLCLDLQ